MATVRIPLGPIRPNPIVASQQPNGTRAVLRLAEAIRRGNDRIRHRVDLTLAPVEVNYQRLALNYGEIERPGEKPLLVIRGDQLKQISFEAIIVANRKQGLVSCEDKLQTLQALAKTNADCVFVYGGTSTSKRWRITDLSISSVTRSPRTDQITQAKVQITLTEATPKRQIVPGMITIRIPPEERGNTASSESQQEADSSSDSGSDGDPSNGENDDGEACSAGDRNLGRCE